MRANEWTKVRMKEKGWGGESERERKRQNERERERRLYLIKRRFLTLIKVDRYARASNQCCCP